LAPSFTSRTAKTISNMDRSEKACTGTQSKIGTSLQLLSHQIREKWSSNDASNDVRVHYSRPLNPIWDSPLKTALFAWWGDSPTGSDFECGEAIVPALVGPESLGLGCILIC
jgi:hypothetical protein